LISFGPGPFAMGVSPFWKTQISPFGSKFFTTRGLTGFYHSGIRVANERMHPKILPFDLTTFFA